tara:strand:+ start:508 stop:648 length:141 start_codon:yes stop_codon:yes gene_type:complete
MGAGHPACRKLVEKRMLIEANIEMSEAWNITSPILTHKIFKGKEKL